MAKLENAGMGVIPDQCDTNLITWRETRKGWSCDDLLPFPLPHPELMVSPMASSGEGPSGFRIFLLNLGLSLRETAVLIEKQ